VWGADAQIVIWQLIGAPGLALQVLRLELDAGGLPGYLFAPRQCVIRKYMRKEEDGVYTIMFEWVPAAAAAWLHGLVHSSAGNDVQHACCGVNTLSAWQTCCSR
jgi:hypothetical protein